MEPGESIEEAARREVFEETGIRLGPCDRLSFEPALALSVEPDDRPHRSSHNQDIAIDREELEDARWFARAEIMQMLENQHPLGLKVPKPAAIAHHLICASLSQG